MAALRHAFGAQGGRQIVATLFAVRWRDTYLLLMHSFAPELQGLSPGIVAMDEMIAERIAAGTTSTSPWAAKAISGNSGCRKPCLI